MVADPTIPPRRRFTVDEYELMGTVGILTEDDRTELLDGEIVPMSPIGPKHGGTTRRISRWLHGSAARISILVQDPIRLSPHSEPEPDVTIARYRDDEYDSAHPTADDVHLIIEVADSSLARDRGVKLPIYAQHGIPEVWIVDLKGRVVHVHTEPDGRGYRNVRTVRRGEELTVTTVEGLSVPVSDILR